MTIRNEKGFTLLEVLVSLSIFTIAALGMAKNFTDHLWTNTRNERKSEAIMAAQRVLDQLRVTDPATLPTTGSAAPQAITFGRRTYQVTVTYCATTTYCTSNNTRQLKADVRLNGSLIYSVDTVYSQLK